MNSILHSKQLREALMFTGLLGLALLASTVVGDIAFATSLIDNSDNIEAVSVATDGATNIRDLLKTILNFALSFLGFVATIMVIYGGILYVTAAGNEENATKAKKIIMYAVVGIIIILLSFALVNTVLGAATGGSVTTT